MLLIPYSYGDKFESTDDYGSVGYIKCSKCGKMANFTLQTGTLQNHIDGVLPAGRKRDTYVLECSKCGSLFIPHDDKVDSFIELTKKFPASFDFDEMEEKVAEAYANKTEVYLAPEQELERFPLDCVNKLAKNESKKYQDAVREVATAFVFNKEWPKTKSGKREKRWSNTKKTVRLLWMVFIIAMSIIMFFAFAYRASK